MVGCGICLLAATALTCGCEACEVDVTIFGETACMSEVDALRELDGFRLETRCGQELKRIEDEFGQWITGGYDDVSVGGDFLEEGLV